MTGAFDHPDVVQHRAARLGALLAAADVAPRPLAFPRERIGAAQRHAVFMRRLRIAAVAALLLAGAGVPPVRAWIVDTVRTILRRATGAAEPAPVLVPAAPAAAAEALGSVTFVPQPGTFVLRVAAHQAEGAIAIEVVDGDRATARISGAIGSAELLVMPDGVRIANARTASAGYLLRVPAGTTRVVVQVERDAARVFTPGAIGDRWTVSLVRGQR